MTIKTSTGLRDAMLSSNSLKGALDGGRILIFSGTAPATADDATDSGNVLLLTVSLNATGGGINFADVSSSGTLTKSDTEVWSGVVGVSGTASFYRHVASGDSGTGASTSAARIQGTIGTSGADMNRTSTALSSGATETVDYYSVTLPTA